MELQNNISSSKLLEMKNIKKSFPGVYALRGVDLSLAKGEVLALVGENGAGKSTLIKVLGGAHLPDSGEILIEGIDTNIHTPVSARESGVSVIYQEFNLIPQLTVQENIFLGNEITKGIFVDKSEELKRTHGILNRLGVELNPTYLCSELTVAQCQIVEIARALIFNSKIIVMDEPTAALTIKDVKRLYEIILDLKLQGIGIIYISHRLEEIFEIADRVMVLRDGEHICTNKVEDMTKDQLIEKMVGRPMKSEFPVRVSKIGPEKMRVEKLRCEKSVKDVSFHLHKGEILGFAGLVGAGRTETMRLLFGADRPESGNIFIDGKEVKIKNPSIAIKNRICLLTEDRKGQGLILIHSVIENFGLPNLDIFRKGVFIDKKKEKNQLSNYVKSLNIKISDSQQLIMNLSGGNQQKVVLAKWLERNADIIIFDEPTRGIDVGAKYEIYLLMNRLANEGKSIIMVSSELPEIIGMSDRIIVMHKGEVKGEMDNSEKISQEKIMSMALS